MGTVQSVPNRQAPVDPETRLNNRVQRSNNQKEETNCHSKPTQLSTNYKSIINIWHMLYQIAKQEAWVPTNCCKRYVNLLKILKIQLFLKKKQINQGTRMTLQVKPQASIPVSTYSQEAFVSPFATSRILEQRNGSTFRQEIWRLEAYTREGHSTLYFYHCENLYYTISRAEFPFGCKQ